MRKGQFFQLRPITKRRLQKFRQHRRGWWSLWIFLTLLTLSLFAEFIANNRPLLVFYEGQLYWPVFQSYPETTFGGEFTSEADYQDPYVSALIDKKGWILWPLVRYRYDTIIKDLNEPAPSAPSLNHLLGTDDQARDVVARLIYGFRVSVLFGLILTLVSTMVGMAAGAIQGYFGGKTDLIFQRLLEIWGGLPTLFILITVASIIQPGFWTLLTVMLLFSWTWPVALVRAEFLRSRKLEYVRAARSMGASHVRIIWRHILPNASVAMLTFLPFTLASSMIMLTALDFLGLGLPVGSASLGELLAQGKANLQAPWLGISGFVTISFMMILVMFIGEAVRHAFDPRGQ
ncbi:MAG: ABC transporter permease [Rhodospirillaceae bacterium]|nr:ABC transporter permease [Rhodospirillaceae bacterium]